MALSGISQIIVGIDNLDLEQWNFLGRYQKCVLYTAKQTSTDRLWYGDKRATKGTGRLHSEFEVVKTNAS